jgi:hypothetical protein
MATLIVPEAAESESLLHRLTPPPPPKALQRLLQESLSVLSHWYGSHGGGDETGKVGDDGEEGIPLVQLSSSPAPRLHPAAESCLSSLRAGTASIATGDASPDFLNLPVRQTHLKHVTSWIYLFILKGRCSSTHILLPGRQISLSTGADLWLHAQLDL